MPVSFSSVTIVDADGAKADGWCTALFAMGREKALAYLREHPEIRAFLLSPDEKTAWVSEGLAPRLTLLAPDVKLNILTRQHRPKSEKINRMVFLTKRSERKSHD